MQKLTVKHTGATVTGPVDLRLFDMAVQRRNEDVLGSRWPSSGAFALAEGETIALESGDVLLIGDAGALSDTAPKPKGRGKGRSAPDAKAD